MKYHDPATLRASAENLLDDLYDASELLRKAKNKHLPQLEIVLLGLFKASHTEDHCMAVQLDSNRFSDMKHLSYRVTVELIVNGLIQLGLLIKHTGYYGGLIGSVSRLQLTNPMLKLLKESELDPNLIVSDRPRTLIRIKPPKGSPDRKPVLSASDRAEIQH